VAIHTYTAVIVRTALIIVTLGITLPIFLTVAGFYDTENFKYYGWMFQSSRGAQNMRDRMKEALIITDRLEDNMRKQLIEIHRYEIATV
jgi:hypothetical protein